MSLFDEFKDIIDNSTYQYITRKNIAEHDLKTRKETINAIGKELDDLLDDKGRSVSIPPPDLPYEVLHHLVNIPQVYSVIRYKQEGNNKENILVIRDDHAMMMIGVDGMYQTVLAFNAVTMDHYVFRLSLIDKDPYFDGSDTDDLMKTAMVKQSVPVINSIYKKRMNNREIATSIVEIVERFALGYAPPSQ